MNSLDTPPVEMAKPATFGIPDIREAEPDSQESGLRRGPSKPRRLKKSGKWLRSPPSQKKQVVKTTQEEFRTIYDDIQDHHEWESIVTNPNNPHENMNAESFEL